MKPVILFLIMFIVVFLIYYLFVIRRKKYLYKFINGKEVSYLKKVYKINIKEAMPTLYYSNIILFENTNQTLPLGMNLSDEVLVDLSKYKLEETNKEEFKMNYLQDEYTNRIIKVHCIEYNVK